MYLNRIGNKLLVLLFKPNAHFLNLEATIFCLMAKAVESNWLVNIVGLADVFWLAQYIQTLKYVFTNYT